MRALRSREDSTDAESESLAVFRSILTALIVCAPLGAAVASAPADDRESTIPVANPIILTQIPTRGPVETGESSTPRRVEADLPPGSRIVLFDPSNPAAGATNLTPGFATAGRPDLSFDGRRILFVGRRAADESLDVWEMGIDGEALRRIVRRPEDCTRAIYLSTLYTLDADEPHRRIAFCVAEDEDRRPGPACAALYTSRMDGSDSRRVTFNPYGVSAPLLLTDGRLLYAGMRPPESGGGSAWFTINTDGTDVSIFAAAHEAPAIRSTPCETSDGRIVYVESAAGGWPGGGALVQVLRTRSLHTRRNLTEDAGEYYSPSALPDGRLLVSHRSDGGRTYGLHRLDERSDPRLVAVFDSPDWHELDAVVIRPREVPAGRSSVVDERVEYGYLYCLDSYLTDRKPAGEADLKEIKMVRVRRASTGAAGTRSRLAEEVLGEAEVRADGSFYLQVPARTSLRLETLDAAGEPLRAMENWIWVMPNERRGCVGCHEDREMTPPNRHVLALRAEPHKVGVRQDSEADATGGHSAPRGYGK